MGSSESGCVARGARGNGQVEPTRFSRFRKKLAKKRWIQFLLLVFLGILTACIEAAEEVPGGGTLLPVFAFFLAFVGIVMSFLNWSCPVCKRYLGGGVLWWAPKFCRNCGARLD